MPKRQQAVTNVLRGRIWCGAAGPSTDSTSGRIGAGGFARGTSARDVRLASRGAAGRAVGGGGSPARSPEPVGATWPPWLPVGDPPVGVALRGPGTLPPRTVWTPVVPVVAVRGPGGAWPVMPLGPWL